MTRLLLSIAAAALFLGGAFSLHAEPMKCSNEYKACTTLCGKSVADQTAWRTCMTSCSMHQATCRQTGCWNFGPRNYCGLLRQ